MFYGLVLEGEFLGHLRARVQHLRNGHPNIATRLAREVTHDATGTDLIC